MRFMAAGLIVLNLGLAPTPADSHPGGLDDYGCHKDRKRGGYHCHRGQFEGRSFVSQAEMLTFRQQAYTAVPPFLPTVQLTGKIVSVTDGDTLDVLHDGKTERIRLNGIDCPEKRQAFGNKAKQATSGMVFDKQVTITTHGQDKYGRTIGDLILPDGRSLSQELVREGMCWWYRKYAPGDTKLERLETEARAAKRGLWREPNPIPPWEWRHGDGQ